MPGMHLPAVAAATHKLVRIQYVPVSRSMSGKVLVSVGATLASLWADYRLGRVEHIASGRCLKEYVIRGNETSVSNYGSVVESVRRLISLRIVSNETLARFSLH